MLTPAQFDEWANNLGLSREARAVLGRLRTQAPLRNVSNSAGNLCGSFASEKLGQTIQWESWTGERCIVLAYEHDRNCLELWDQALKPKISYTLPNGRKSGARTTIDYVLLRRDWCGGLDFKTSAELRKLAVEQPYRWVQVSATKWDQPPTREALAHVGLQYELVSEHDLPYILLRNIDFLRPRLLRTITIPSDAQQALQALLASERRALLTTAIDLVGDANIIYEGHFRGRWHLNLTDEAVPLPDCAWVYRDLTTCRMFGSLSRSSVPLLTERIDPETIPIGAQVRWGDEFLTVLNRTKQEITLSGPVRQFVRIPKSDFIELTRAGDIRSARRSNLALQAGIDILLQVTDQAVDEAIRKLDVLESVRAGLAVSACKAPRRTYYDWKRAYEEGERAYGNGFIGLLTRHDRKGNRSHRTEPTERDAMASAFKWLRAQVPREPKAGYAVYVAQCANEDLEPRSFASFCEAWNAEDEHAKTLDREGVRAAYPTQAPRTTGGSHIAQGPMEGDSPFGRVHIDHVQSNVFTRRFNSSLTLGKPWLSIAIDAFTRWVIGLWISMLAPSHASVMMVLRDIVRRHGLLPMTVITDGGRDFKCQYVKRFMGVHVCEHALRPGNEPRYGNPIERLNLDIHHHLTSILLGSNEVLKRPRNSSKTHDPRDLAYLNVQQFALHVEDLLFVRYPDKHHDGLQCTVNEKLADARAIQGTSWGRPVTFDDQLLFQTLAQPHKHGGLMRQRDGIRLNSHNYYSDALVGHDHDRLPQSPIYDPEDPTYIMAKVDGRWTRCQMIDSQMRRLPPPDHRRYYLGERIFLARPSTHKDKEMAYLQAMGDRYAAIDEERESAVAADSAAGSPQEPEEETSPRVPTHSNNPSPLQPAPISRRSR